MKILAVSLALIIATTGVTFLGLLTWNEINEPTNATWTNYQACVETEGLLIWHGQTAENKRAQKDFPLLLPFAIQTSRALAAAMGCRGLKPAGSFYGQLTDDE